MKHLKVTCILFLVLSCFIYAGTVPWEITQTNDGIKFLSDRFIVVVNYNTPPLKMHDSINGYAHTGVKSVDEICRKFGVIEVEPFYKAKLRQPLLKTEISRMYIFTIENPEVLSLAIEALNENPDISLADLYIIPDLYYIPNDPLVLQQWHLAQSHTYEAWDVVRGDTSGHSIIAIIDTGVNWNHSDITANIWVNDPEDLNGNGILDPEDINSIDDDRNGYVDDVIGWDLGSNDNDPREDTPTHGTAVAGCASEVADNALQGAGIGFSARLMCLKASGYNGWIIYGYQAMIYAADNGAHIVNCSWGSGQYNESGQNIINHLWQLDVMVIACAGYDTTIVYPAGYEHVMAVTATDQNDILIAGYGDYIDICAPGDDIWTTWGFGSFTRLTGTSLASPMVAGLAGLVRAWYPNLSNDEAQILIENAADSIDHLNPGYEGMLGAGRINCAACFVTTDVDNIYTIPGSITLYQNHPNPFNAQTLIKFELSEPQTVQLDIYNILGQRVIPLIDKIMGTGEHCLNWHADGYPSGIYFARLRAGQYQNKIKMTLIK